LQAQFQLENKSNNNNEEEQEGLIKNKARPMTTLFSDLSSQSIANLNMSNMQQQQQQQQQQSEQMQTIADESFLQDSMSLLDWIKSTDTRNQLNSVIEETKEMQKSFDENFKWHELQANINKLLDQIDNNPQMREIEGLTKRLQDLNSLLDNSKKFLDTLNETVESFSSNLKRVNSLKDESILQDLCKGHERQLEQFKTSHAKMIEITRKISKAKLELIRVVHSRLK
jgi:hypothetical protein